VNAVIGYGGRLAKSIPIQSHVIFIGDVYGPTIIINCSANTIVSITQSLTKEV